MDLQMPVMDGFEAARRIRALRNPVKASTPIIALSATSNQSCHDMCYSAGMNELLSKPITIQNLLRALEKYVK